MSSFDPRRESLFLSHGAPSLPLEDGPAVDFLRGLGASMEKPSAILVLSAHWETKAPAFTAAARPETIHDFFGFPDALYRLSYPAPGSPELAEKARALCAGRNLAATLDPKRGLDHGAWVPLLLMFPQAEIPVVQASLPFAQGARGAFALGEALRPLLREKVLLLASGGFIHNLRALDRGEGETPPWSELFQAWAKEALLGNRLEDLFEAKARAPEFPQAHPREEHWLPLFFALGAAGSPWNCRPLHTGFEYGSLAMDAYAFSTAEPGR
jgi:4,5-DOPA dioxygenase extradiol